MSGPPIVMVCIVYLSIRPSLCLSHANISETKRDRKLIQETGLSDSESAIRFIVGSMVPPFGVFPGWHFAHSDRNGPVGLA